MFDAKTLPAYISQVQDEACTLAGLMEGVDLLYHNAEARNACAVLISLARDKATGIYEALDAMNLPRA